MYAKGTKAFINETRMNRWGFLNFEKVGKYSYFFLCF